MLCITESTAAADAALRHASVQVAKYSGAFFIFVVRPPIISDWDFVRGICGLSTQECTEMKMHFPGDTNQDAEAFLAALAIATSTLQS